MVEHQKIPKILHFLLFSCMRSPSPGKKVNIFAGKFQLDRIIIQFTTAFSSFSVFSRSLTIFFRGDLWRFFWILLYTLADSGQKLLPLKIQWRSGCKIELTEQKYKLDVTNFSFWTFIFYTNKAFKRILFHELIINFPLSFSIFENIWITHLE